MPIAERYRMWFEYERDCNSKTLDMLDSVPPANRSESRFKLAVGLADHVVACREKWLDYMTGGTGGDVSWRNEECEFTTLRSRFIAMEKSWQEFLRNMDDQRLEQEFRFFEEDGVQYLLPNEIQVAQLMGHALYHRGQIALLVEQLDGEVVDTDYADWWWYNMRPATEGKVND